MVVSWETGGGLVCPPEEIVDFLPIVETEDMLSPRVNEVLVNIVHDIVQDNVAHSEFFVIGEGITVTIQVI